MKASMNALHWCWWMMECRKQRNSELNGNTERYKLWPYKASRRWYYGESGDFLINFHKKEYVREKGQTFTHLAASAGLTPHKHGQSSGHQFTVFRLWHAAYSQLFFSFFQYTFLLFLHFYQWRTNSYQSPCIPCYQAFTTKKWEESPIPEMIA